MEFLGHFKDKKLKRHLRVEDGKHNIVYNDTFNIH
jgi:hypothetical protein